MAPRKQGRSSLRSIQQLVESLNTHRVNTMTELRRIEQFAASCDNEADALAFQEPMTLAWSHYVNSNFLSELRGLTPNYPFSADVTADAQHRVLNDPQSNRSWNMAWLCLVKIQDDNLIPQYAAVEAARPEMWTTVDDATGETVYNEPLPADCAQLAECFEYEWTLAVTTMLRHWSTDPTWY